MSSRLSVCSLVLCCVVLTGCTGAKLMKESPDNVVVKAPKGKPELAVELAEASCKKHGKSASLVGATEAWIGNYGKVGPWKYVFTCK